VTSFTEGCCSQAYAHFKFTLKPDPSMKPLGLLTEASSLKKFKWEKVLEEEQAGQDSPVLAALATEVKIKTVQIRNFVITKSSSGIYRGEKPKQCHCQALSSI
jgi:hypothetical protein